MTGYDVFCVVLVGAVALFAPSIWKFLRVDEPDLSVLDRWEEYDSVEYCAELWDDVFPVEWNFEVPA